MSKNSKWPPKIQPLRKFGVFFCKKNTKTGRILLHNMVNHIRGRLTSIISIKMLKSAEIQNGRQKYIHQANWAFFVRKTPKTCGIIDNGRLIHNTPIYSFEMLKLPKKIKWPPKKRIGPVFSDIRVHTTIFCI